MLLIVVVLCIRVLHAYNDATSHDDYEIEQQIDRILEKRDIPMIMEKCKNGVLNKKGDCICNPPYSGINCQDFACVNGYSVGERYDPDSLMFSTPCICDAGWSGELCEYKIDSRCRGRGEWKNNECECMENFYGDECQYTDVCHQGSLEHGRCVCEENFQGDHCETIICQFGKPNNNITYPSCDCPPKYSGRFCDRCSSSQSGPKFYPYPSCSANFKRKKILKTRKYDPQMYPMLRFIIMGCAFLALSFIPLTFYLLKKKPWQRRLRNSDLQLVDMYSAQDRALIPANNSDVNQDETSNRRYSLPSKPKRNDHVNPLLNRCQSVKV